MGTTYDFTLDRAQNTRNAQNTIKARWMWSEKTLDQWDADIKALEAQNETAGKTQAAMLTKRAGMDTALDQLDRWTGEGLTLMRLKLRNDPGKLATLDTLTANGTSRANKLSEALAWENAWDEIDNTFAPTLENNFTAFEALRKQCVGLFEQYGAAETDVTRDNNLLTTLVAKLEDDNQAWYKAATKICKRGTPRRRPHPQHRPNHRRRGAVRTFATATTCSSHTAKTVIVFIEVRIYQAPIRETCRILVRRQE
jgi:hypothetical protein